MSRPPVAPAVPPRLVLQPPASIEWRRFEATLASTLRALGEDECLVIDAKHRARYVQFAGEGAFGLRAEAVSNAWLPEDDQMPADTVALLLSFGWGDPGVDPASPARGRSRAVATVPEAPGQIDDGAGGAAPPRNFAVAAAPPVAYRALARLAVRTLRDGWGIGHPCLLEYKAFTLGGDAIRFPALRLRVRSEVKRTPPPEVAAPPPPVLDVSAGEWKAVQRPDEGFARVCTQDDETVAMVAGQGFADAVGRARLMAAAPALRDAAHEALVALRAIYEHETGPARRVAGSVIPHLALALHEGAGLSESALAVRGPVQ